MQGSSSPVQQNIVLKIFVIAALVILLLIPSVLILAIVSEREGNMHAVERELGALWGGQQTLGGPILSVPFLHHKQTKDGEIKTKRCYAHFLPTTLNISGEIEPVERSRGIYSALLYSAEVEMNARFEALSFDQWEVDSEDILWDQAVLSVGMTNARGLVEPVAIAVDGQAMQVNTGSAELQQYKSGVVAGVTNLNQLTPFSVSVRMHVNGDGMLGLLPLGKETHVRLTSPWPHPKFEGAYLPVRHDVADDGFTSEWSVLDVNRDFPQRWKCRTIELQSAGFGVTLLKSVDLYQQVTRAVKYAVLFIGFTFMAIFLVEVLHPLRIHPVQYILIGLALVLFYLLLLSLSEVIAFPVAYAIAAGSVVVMLSVYVFAVARKAGPAFAISATIAGLYGFLYVLLQLEDLALLLGSITLFVVLAVVMYLTRKVNWYELTSSAKKKSQVNPDSVPPVPKS